MLDRLEQFKKLIAMGIGVFLVICLLAPLGWVEALRTKDVFPKKANYFLKWEITDDEAQELAKWDLLVLDMETQEKSRTQLQKIRALNPNIIMLVYITPQEIRRDAPFSYSNLRREFFAGIPESWYLHNSQGQRLSWWEGTWTLNVTHNAPFANGGRFNDYVSNFVVNRLLSTGLWDGVFYDNALDNITYFVGENVDSNNDGAVDVRNVVDSAWQVGMKYIYNETRRLSNNKYYIVGNGTTRVYRNELNGNLLENFISEAWTPTMQTYGYDFAGGPMPRLNIINANTANTGMNSDYKKMRFGLASTLMHDGYYSYDYGDRDHSQTWYYDEYDTDLGKSTGVAIAQNGGKNFSSDVWKRNFENGIALVNPTARPQNIDLGGEYEKIHGKQDPFVNDGSIVSETTLDAYDGLVLLKTFSTVNDVLFTNGSFVRFFHPTGERVRNGFFAFEDAVREGGDQIAHIDLDDNGERDLVVVSKNKLLAWREDGASLMKIFPYTASYPGTFRVAIGDIDGDGKKEIAVGPAPGFYGAVKIYNRDGSERTESIYPFGNKYKGGVSLALDIGRLIIGAGRGMEPKVQVYDQNLKLTNTFLAFEKSFSGGVNVASGDIDGDEKSEIVVGAGLGKKPVIRLFGLDGKQKYASFEAYSSIGTPGIDVRVADVDFDGKNDIVALGEGI